MLKLCLLFICFVSSVESRAKFPWRESRPDALTRWAVLSLGLIFFTLAVATPAAAYGQLELITNKEAQCAFAGDARKISVTFHNPSNQTLENQIHARIFQTSSATAVQLSEMSWKKLQVLPQQTVLESAQLDFPPVKVKTKFLVQWLENTNRIIGRTEVLVYPTNLLSELKPLEGDEALGIFDPQNQLKPLLKNLKIDFVNLGNSDLEIFSGKLAIIGPFQSRAQMRDGLANQIKALTKKSASVVWLQPPRTRDEKLLPSFYCVSESTNVVVVVQPELVDDLLGNPQSQLNLIYFCHLALNPQPLTLPGLSPP